MSIGQTITIGTHNAEEALITGFGSLHLAEPLRYDHGANELVSTVAQQQTKSPGRTQSGPSEIGSDNEEERKISNAYESSGGDSEGSKATEFKKVQVADLPRSQTEKKQFHRLLTERILALSKRLDEKDKAFLDKARDAKLSDEKAMASLDPVSYTHLTLPTKA